MNNATTTGAVVALLTGALLVMLGAGPAAAVDYRPDGAVKKVGSGSYKGVGVFNTTGAGQKAKATRSPGKPAEFYARFENTGDLNDLFFFQGDAGNSNFKVKYLTDTGSDNTTEVVAGTSDSTNLDPGERHRFTVKIKPKSSAAVGATFTAKLTATSDGDSAAKDTVKLTVTVG